MESSKTSFFRKGNFTNVFSVKCFWKSNKNKGWVTFPNFTHFSSYLQTKTFVWKQDCSILCYFSGLSCHNFPLILSKVMKLHFLEISLKCLKTVQKWCPYDLPVRNYGLWNSEILNKFTFSRSFFTDIDHWILIIIIDLLLFARCIKVYS